MKTTLLMRLMLRLVRGDTERVLLELIDYLMAQSRVLKKKYEQDCGKRLLLSDQQRWELAGLGRGVITAGYAHVIGIVRPETLMRRYRRLIARKFDSSHVSPRKQGRPEIPPHVSKLILRFARNVTGWDGELEHARHLIHDRNTSRGQRDGPRSHRFGSALNDHLHFHCCVIDGVFEPEHGGDEAVRFREAVFTDAGVQWVQARVRQRVLRWFARQGYLDKGET